MEIAVLALAYGVIPSTINTLKTFLTSPLFGFLLKLLSGLAATGFGLFGIGVETRDDKGELTRNGWVALIGILAAGIIASAISVYEFSVGQQKDQEERMRSRRLMLSVQRILYPIKGVSGHLELTFRQDFAGLKSYKASLRRQLPPANQKCKATESFLCYDQDDSGNIYGIPETSRLFPKTNSVVGAVLNAIGLGFRFVRPAPPRVDLNYEAIGGFGFLLQDASLKGRMITFSPGNDRLGYIVRRFEIPDKYIEISRVSSLVEVFPGFISVSAADSGSVCDAIKKPEVPDCLQTVLKPMRDGLAIVNLDLHFPYPKGLSFYGKDGIKCKYYDGGEGLLTMLPDDIEHLDELGNFDVIVDPKPYEKDICAAFMNPSF